MLMICSSYESDSHLTLDVIYTAVIRTSISLFTLSGGLSLMKPEYSEHAQDDQHARQDYH